MAITLSRYLRLRIDSNLTANSRYNLERIDTLGSTFIVDSANILNVRSESDITIEPQSADIGGTGSGGTVSVGTTTHEISTLNVYASTTNFSDPIGVKDQGTSGTKYLRLKYNSTLNGAVDTTADRTLSMDLEGADRNLTMGGNLQFLGGNLTLTLTANSALTLPTTGTLATLAGLETLTNKTIDADLNTITNIENADVKALAGIIYSKLNLTGGIVNADISASAAIDGTKISPDFGTQNIQTQGELRLSNGSFYSSFKSDALQSASISLKLPTIGPTSNQLLQANASDPTQLQWATIPGTGTVTSVALDMPSTVFDVSGSPITSSGTFAVTLDTQAANTVFSGPSSGAATTPTFRTLINTDLPDTAVTPGSYGSASFTGVFTVNQKGILTSASSSQITITSAAVTDFNEAAQDAVGTILTDTASVDFTYNDAGNTVSAAVLPAGVNHNLLLNFVADEHVNHTAVAVNTNALSGLTGGGTIAATRSLLVDPSNATADTPANADIILFADASAANALKRTTLGDIEGINGFTDDWTTGTSKIVTHNLGTQNVMVYVYELDTPFEHVLVDSVQHTDTNTVTLTSSTAPTGLGRCILIRKVS